ncbi:cache domain-containing sensor histidine kinase [[Clostridium] dakarense]|uniref:cache domain-containing sensor histidine kinase n=1 Tax=Faecalimicrobium dakarense TaxID=1301100 RepID=UPI0004BA6C0C|nr:sensor histidine kinase [[Clostridium] dakarense]
MVNIKLEKKSITYKLFLVLFGLSVSVSMILGIWFINDTNRTVEKEMYNMSNQTLNQISNNISLLLANVESIAKRISIDSKLIEILSIPKEDLFKYESQNKEMDSYAEGLLTDEVWKYGNFSMKPELYVIGENGLVYDTYSKTKYNLNDIKQNNWYEKIVKADGKTILINTYKDENAIGPYKCVFKMGRLIKDLITGKTLGVLIIDISETILYDKYSEVLTEGSYIYIIDKDGSIISTKDKRLVGTNYINGIKIKKSLIYEDEYRVERDKVKYMQVTSNLNEYGWAIVEEIPLSVIRQPIDDLTEKAILVLLLVSIASTIVSYRLSVSITRPILNIKNNMNEVMEGNLKMQIQENRYDEIGQLEKSFNGMVRWLEESIDEIKNKEEQKRIAELSFLQAQINPHFLYNTLSGIRFLVSMNKIEESEEMLYRFTKLLRSLLPKASEMIRLEEEIENIKNYTELQKMRYPDCFEVIYDIDSDINNFKVPSFILQPIVENAILYSMEKEDNLGEISVSGYRSKEGIRIVIEDNGIGMSRNKLESILNKEASINRVGLINVQERVQLNYGPEYGLEVESVEGEGSKITFILPN